MTYRERVVSTVRSAQPALIIGAVLPLVAFVALLIAVGGFREAFHVFGYRAYVAAQVYVVALLAVVLYGAPVYAFLAQTGSANWFTAALVGIAPGVGAFLVGIFPSGRLSNANFTVGPMVMICGVFVALMTHALSVEPGPETTAREARSSTLRRLSRVLVVAAILGQAWTVRSGGRPPAQKFAALNFVSGAAVYVLPFLVAALGCALYSYYTTPRPRGAMRIAEMVAMLGVGIVLLLPAAYVIRML